MKALPSETERTVAGHLAQVIVVGLALAVLAATLGWAAFNLRQRVRTQIAGRDSEIMDAVAQMQHLDDRSSEETVAGLQDTGEQFQLALKISRLNNVLGVRLFSAEGKYVNAFPVYISEAGLPAADLTALKQLRAVSHFQSQARLAEQDLLAQTNAAAVPLLLVEIPLRADSPNHQLVGIVQFLMDGTSIARQYADLDWNLALRFSIAFVVGAIILAAGLGWAMRRVQATNRLLANRTQNLLHANRELALAARVSAVGAITAHLIHGLKNPLGGLANFVSSQRTGGGDDNDWQAALSTTQRMQEMINRVVRVLQEQQSGVEYEISAGELAGLLEQKVRPVAEVAGVRLEVSCTADETLSNHEADLILLVLENLLQNGIEATPRGKLVRLDIIGSRNGLVFEVVDQGFGLPAKVAANLFTPGVSTKKGGGGIGLAISKQLTQHLGATLELVNTSTAGSVFRFTVPIQKNRPGVSAARVV